MLLLWIACAGTPNAPASTRAEPAMVALRPAEALPTLGPDARVDRGLRAAAEELAAMATTPGARLTPSATRIALARAGYPGDARFLRAIGAAQPPADLLAALPHGAAIDVGWAWRDLPDGTRWWVVGWAPRRVGMDPMPRDVTLDGGVPLRVDGAADPRLLLTSPGGAVREVSFAAATSRWLDRFSEPGEYRVEVIDADQVDLLFSLFVETPVPPPVALPGPVTAERPEVAEASLYARLAELRTKAGLPTLTRFPDFEPHARAHARCLSSAGVLAHDTPHCPGVPALAERTHWPRAKHHEDVAAADSTAEAWERMVQSPGHLQNLLCRACSHVSVGAVLEPPRLVVAVEMLEFPDGPPGALRVEPGRGGP